MLFELTVTFVVAFAGGFIGPIAGGGGLLIVPTLIVLGLAPEMAIACTRAGSIGLWLAAITRYHKAGVIDWKLSRSLIGLALVGGYVGSQLLVYLSAGPLDKIVAVLLLGLLPLVVICNPKNLAEKPGRLRVVLGYLLFFCVMIFAGFFSAGDGTLGIYVLSLCFGLNVVEANAARGPAWLVVATVAVTNFIYQGLVSFPHAAVLFLGMAIGANFGAKMALSRGEKLVKIVLGMMVTALAVKLLFFN